MKNPAIMPTLPPKDISKTGRFYPSFREDFIIFLLFFLAGVILMYVGYFSPYSENYFILYFVIIVLLGTCYVVYYGLIAAPQKAIYNWIFMFMIFPKKELRPNMESLLNVGLGFSNVGLSMYYVLDIFVVLAMVLTIITRKNFREQQRIPSNVRFLYLTYCVMALVGLVHIILSWFYLQVLGEVGYDRMFVSFWPLLVGLVVFPASLYFINTREQVEKIFLITVLASVILLVEFIVSKYTSFLPEQVVYYSLNYRNAFRSVLQSGDLFVTQILIMGGASALYFCFSKRKTFYGILFVFFSYLVLETYNRGSFFAIIIVGILMVASSLRLNKWKLYILSTLLLFGIIYYAVTFGQKSLEMAGEFLDLGGVKEEGYFSLSSTFTRIGASFRGMDVFLYVPIFGSGPGNLILFMTSPYVPGYIDTDWMDPHSLWFYERIVSNLHPTDTHNLYIRILAEYGVVGIIVIFATIKVLFSNYYTFKREFIRKDYLEMYSLYLVKLCSYSVVIAYAFYFMFQAGPLLYGLFFLLLRLTLLNRKDWHSWQYH